MSINEIKISKARVHNLKDVDVTIPRDSFTVITGPSGSGKSSLAFDTIYVEGQRRYIESLSSYARQFLGQFQPPEADSITGLSPTIAIDQKSTNKNPRSTVGTITEIYDYLRVLFARVGTSYCPNCNQKIKGQSAQKIVDSILKLSEKTKVQILSPVIKNKKGEHKEEISKYMSLGLSKARIDGEIRILDDQIQLKKTVLHNIEIIIDRLVIRPGIEKRLNDSIEYALKLSQGTAIILIDEDKEIYYSELNSCPNCDLSFPQLEPRTFSFNSPIGACSYCNGLGEIKDFQDDLMIIDSKLSIEEGGIGPLAKKSTFLYQMVKSMAKEEKVDLKKPVNQLPKGFLNTLFNGSKKLYTYSFKSENSSFNFSKIFPGIRQWLNKKYHETSSEKTRKSLEAYMRIQNCQSCQGQRLNPFALATKLEGNSIIDICNLSLEKTYIYFKSLSLKGEEALISKKILKEINSRLEFLLNVGLGYLTLNRGAGTLSGGEGQRIRLATQIGSSLCGVIYVLDEPSIGLHQRDNQRLIKTMISLKNLGNTVLVVEHDEETIRAADHIIDMGPGAGLGGGEIVAQGTLEQILKNKKSLTGRYLSGDEFIPIPLETRTLNNFLILTGATQNNIKNLDVEIPLNGLICITGISGSGKSTLMHDILVPAIKAQMSKSRKYLYQKNNYNSLTGVEKIKTLVELDQSPIGRTPHSNPATYSSLFDYIRLLLAKTPESQIRGYTPGRFSFNVKGGRCEECEGDGVKKIEMHFLPDVYITCSECNGKRYNRETLSILYKGKNVADILDLTIEEAFSLFQNHTRLNRTLGTLMGVGLGYMKLGQPATTLSGGEAQRLKLAKELSKRTKGDSLYILDEPTTGLHFRDVQLLLKALNNLVDQQHTVIVIEHNLDVIKTADYIIDLGPEGGDKGGKIVGKGDPWELAKNKESHTGAYLKKLLKK